MPSVSLTGHFRTEEANDTQRMLAPSSLRLKKQWPRSETLLTSPTTRSFGGRWSETAALIIPANWLTVSGAAAPPAVRPERLGGGASGGGGTRSILNGRRDMRRRGLPVGASS